MSATNMSLGVAEVVASAVTSAQAWVALGVGVLGLMAAAYKWRHEQLRKFPLEHLKMLQEAAQGDPLVVRGVTRASHMEVFRQVFGTPGNPLIAKYMFELLDTGEFSLRTLRAAAPYAEVVGGEVVIKPGAVSTVLGAAYGIAATIILSSTAVWVLRLFGTGSIAGALSGLGVELAGLGLASIFIRLAGTEWAAHDCAKRATNASPNQPDSREISEGGR